MMLLDLPASRDNSYDCMVMGLVHTRAVAVNAEYAVPAVAEFAADAAHALVRRVSQCPVVRAWRSSTGSRRSGVRRVSQCPVVRAWQSSTGSRRSGVRRVSQCPVV